MDMFRAVRKYPSKQIPSKWIPSNRKHSKMNFLSYYDLFWRDFILYLGIQVKRDSSVKGFTYISKGFTCIMKGFTHITKGFTYFMKGFTFIVKGFTYIMNGFTKRIELLSKGSFWRDSSWRDILRRDSFRQPCIVVEILKFSALVPQESFLPTIKCWSPCGVENDMVGRKKGSCAEKKPLWHHHHLHLGIKRKASPVYFDRWWEKHHMKK